MTKGRYSLGDKDLLARIKELEDRISRLERTPQTAFSGVNTEGITVKGGAIEVIRDDEASQVEISMGSNVSIESVLGMASVMRRSDAVPTGIFAAGDPVQQFGGESYRFNSIDGSVQRADGTFDLTNCNPTALINDKAGFAILSDTLGARRGMGDPRLHYAAYPSTLTTSVSGTFADILTMEWSFYHPHLQFTIISSNDASTGGEINIVALTDNRIITTWPTTVGVTEFEQFSIKRTSLAFGGDGPDGTISSNGNSEYISIQFRRSSGAGTARFRLVGVKGVDLSFTGDF